MIEVRCDGGRIGRLWWENSSQGGVFYRHRQPCTVLRPGRWGWDQAWPDWHPWPVMPWGKGDPADDYWRDFTAFGPWFADQCERQGIDLDLNITDQISIYSMFCNVFDAGVAAGRDPWRWAAELQRRQGEQLPTNKTTTNHTTP
jgi:hypothetical protein